jgi:histidinol-phosphate phosphatase family protein
MKPAFIFDRDGTVNVSPGPGYVLRWDDFHFMPGVFEMLEAVHARRFVPVLITNQQCVGKGLITREELDAIHARMQAELGALAFADILVCPHLDGTCACRKPSPQLVFDAAARHDLDLASSWNVGDNERDIEMGRRAGVGINIRIGSNEFPDWASVLRRWWAD